MPFNFLTKATQTATVSFNPSAVLGTNYKVGSNFTVAIQVSNITGLWGWTMTIAWDPSVLQLIGSPTEGSFLKSAGNTVFFPTLINNTIGEYSALMTFC